MLDRHITTNGHIVHVGAERATDGWNVREQVDATTVHVEHYDDWHRVERAIQMLEIRLISDGGSALRKLSVV